MLEITIQKSIHLIVHSKVFLTNKNFYFSKQIQSNTLIYCTCKSKVLIAVRQNKAGIYVCLLCILFTDEEVLQHRIGNVRISNGQKMIRIVLRFFNISQREQGTAISM